MLSATRSSKRIICLTDDTVEPLYQLGEQDRIVPISGYCVHSPEAPTINRGSASMIACIVATDASSKSRSNLAACLERPDVPMPSLEMVRPAIAELLRETLPKKSCDANRHDRPILSKLAVNSAASGRHDVGIGRALAGCRANLHERHLVIFNFCNHSYTFGRQPSTTSTSAR
jgi:hypothetical protein